MKCVVQRVWMARLAVDGVERAAFDGAGVVVLAGFEETDLAADAGWVAEKIAHLRIFADEQGKMNLSVVDVSGEILVVPNFTLAGDVAKGRRPSFDRAMKPERSEPLFREFVEGLARLCPRVHAGVFGADMRVTIGNDGPVTMHIDSAGRPGSGGGAVDHRPR